MSIAFLLVIKGQAPTSFFFLSKEDNACVAGFFCVCVWFVCVCVFFCLFFFYPCHKDSHTSYSREVNAGYLLNLMSLIFSCMCTQTRPRYILSSERVGTNIKCSFCLRIQSSSKFYVDAHCFHVRHQRSGCIKSLRIVIKLSNFGILFLCVVNAVKELRSPVGLPLGWLKLG